MRGTERCADYNAQRSGEVDSLFYAHPRFPMLADAHRRTLAGPTSSTDEEEMVQLAATLGAGKGSSSSAEEDAKRRAERWQAVSDEAAAATGCCVKETCRPFVKIVLIFAVVFAVFVSIFSVIVFYWWGWSGDDIKDMVMKAIPQGLSSTPAIAATLSRYRIVSAPLATGNPWAAAATSPALLGWLDLTGCLTGAGTLAWNLTWIGITSNDAGNAALVIRPRDPTAAISMIPLPGTPQPGYTLLASATGGKAACAATTFALANGDGIFFALFRGIPPAAQPNLVVAGLIVP